ncbi:MAG: hypothetical protein ACD_58C00167G0004 [uncultured bacterium]|nr:MAG: hypothetical protein ACD_58C00167G0004 [uncultured bacterium]
MYYTGITTNLEKRIKAHNNKKGAKYTSGRLPVKLCYNAEGYSQSEARREEFVIKSLKRREKEKLITESNLIKSDLVCV